MVRSDLVVLPEPSIDNDLGLFGGVEPFSVEDFFSQGAIKARVRPAALDDQGSPSGSPCLTASQRRSSSSARFLS